MTPSLCRICCITLIVILGLTSLPLQAAQSQTVSPSELRDAVRKAAAAKQNNLEQVKSFFADPAVKAAMAKGRIDANRVQTAVSSLNAEELAKLAAKTSQIQSDFAAGALTNQQLTYIVIALVTAVLILVLVAA